MEIAIGIKGQKRVTSGNINKGKKTPHTNELAAESIEY